MIRYSIVFYFTRLIRNLDFFWLALKKGRFKNFPKVSSGYAVISCSHIYNKKYIHHGPVEINGVYFQSNTFVSSAGET